MWPGEWGRSAGGWPLALPSCSGGRKAGAPPFPNLPAQSFCEVRIPFPGRALGHTDHTHSRRGSPRRFTACGAPLTHRRVTARRSSPNLGLGTLVPGLGPGGPAPLGELSSLPAWPLSCPPAGPGAGATVAIVWWLPLRPRGLGHWPQTTELLKAKAKARGRAVSGTRREPGRRAGACYTFLTTVRGLEMLSPGPVLRGEGLEARKPPAPAPFLQTHEEVVLGGLPPTDLQEALSPPPMTAGGSWAAGPCGISASALGTPGHSCCSRGDLVLVGRGHPAGRPCSLSLLLLLGVAGKAGTMPAGREAEEKVCG